MEQINLFTIDALQGFEGNHSETILSEITAMSTNTLTDLYKATQSALLACQQSADNSDLPLATMEHFRAIYVTIMQELTNRTVTN